jgi:glycine cleavage system transcriptional repressor
MTQSRPVAVTAIGSDRPGIVAGVTEVLYDLGCNLEDATSTILRGHFSMVLIVRTPDDTDMASLEDRLSEVAERLELVITARHVDETRVEIVAPTHMVSVYGLDRPGLVFRVAELVAKAGGNITDLESRVIGPEDSPVYALMLEVALDEGADLGPELERLKSELGVDVSVHRVEADVF